MNALKNFKKYLTKIMGLAALLLLIQAGTARASSFNSFHSDIDRVNDVTVVSVTERDNVGGGHILDIIIENEKGERALVHICDSDCPQLFPNGSACPLCAAHYQFCKDALEAIAGTNQRVSFKVYNGYVQGHDTGNGFHCFDTLG
jgi:hypothetical protein